MKRVDEVPRKDIQPAAIPRLTNLLRNSLNSSMGESVLNSHHTNPENIARKLIAPTITTGEVQPS